MSSCAASCSICCRQGSCVSATSVSSPIATAPRSCRCACSCSAEYCKTQLHRHHSPQIRLIHSGTARSAVEPCASSNGSPLRNSCFAHHLNQTNVQHEALSISSILARAPARVWIPCLVHRRHSNASLSSLHFGPWRGPCAVPSRHQTNGYTQLCLFLTPLHPLRP